MVISISGLGDLPNSRSGWFKSGLAAGVSRGLEILGKKIDQKLDRKPARHRM
jgi:hypothetical protein